MTNPDQHGRPPGREQGQQHGHYTERPDTRPGVSASTGRRNRERAVELPAVVEQIAARAAAPGFERWLDQVRRVGGCAQPVHLTGGDPAGYHTGHEPDGTLLVPCKTRRASRCPACSQVYSGDMRHLVRAGLAGGKGVPVEVAEHPRLFVTLTAPSFGPVHTRRDRTGRHGRALPCRPRRDGRYCEHGRPAWCGIRHAADDPALGQPLCPACFDYTGAVLFNAHAGRLWQRFTETLPVVLAGLVGLSRNALRRQARVGFAKVAEFQARGLVHLHAVIRLDGPDGPGDPPPIWANAEQLDQAVRAAASRVEVDTTHSPAVGEYVLRWGDQIDTQPIPAAAGGAGELTAQVVAGYVAKYATKSAGTTGVLDRRVGGPAEIAALPVTEHERRLIGACWRLGALPEFEDLRLHAWAHMLGYRGHVVTKSRRYSTTLAALRQARRDHRTRQTRAGAADARDRQAAEAGTGSWRYARHGYASTGDAMLAAGVREDLAAGREAAWLER